MDELIEMIRDEPAQPGGPVEAQVHPDEVESWAEQGWRIAPTNTQEGHGHPVGEPVQDAHVENDGAAQDAASQLSTTKRGKKNGQ